jgi:S1-C subfamily serine protease
MMRWRTYASTGRAAWATMQVVNVNRSRLKAGLGGAVIVVLLLAGCTSSSSKGSSSSTSTSAANTGASSASPSAQALQSSYIDVVNKVRPSVVEIRTDSGLGSGVVYDTKGNIVTNDHVVRGATTFQVTFFDGKTLPAKLVGEFAPDDLAMVSVTGASSLTPANFADSSKVQVGEIALAIGNPLGFSSSVTNGIVSFNGRTVPEDRTVTLANTIQTSAPINPGNSGGALADLDSNVMGIPTLGAQDQQSGGAASGIGFAIPSNTVKLIAGQLASQGKVTNSGRAALGVSATTGYNSSGQPGGVIVVQVQPGSAADKAGLKSQDVITSVNGQKITSQSSLNDVLAGLKPGDQAKVTVTRADGSQQTVTVTLGQLPG